MPNPDTRARYVTGDNAPGYLPDVEPRGPWNSWADACRDLARNIEDDAETRLDDADHEAEGDERGDAQSYVRSQLEAARAEVEALRTAEQPAGADVVFMGRAFFIRPAEGPDFPSASDAELELVAVEDLREGDACDLQGDGYAQGDAFAAAEFELFEVCGFERETADCVRVDFEGADSVGFPPGHVLRTRRAARHPYTVIAAVQEGATRGRFWHVMLSSPAAFFERGDTPSEAPEAGAELREAWEVLAILPGHVTPEYLAD